VDSPSLRRKVLVPTAAAAPVSHSNSVLDEKVVFGHERSAGGANTLRLMQSDIDLVNVVGGADSNRLHNDSQSQSLQIGAVSSSTTFHNPYAAPFVPGQALPHSRKVLVNGHAPHQQHQQHQQQHPQHQAAAQVPLTLHGAAVTTPLTINPTPSSYYQQDLSLMSNSVLNSGVSLNNKGNSNGGNSNGGNISSNSSLAGGGPSRLLYDLDFQDTLLDSASDYFGDSLSLNGDSSSVGRGASNNLLLSSLRENSTELRDDSLLDEYPPAINLSNLGGLNSLGLGSGLTSGLGGGNAARGGAGAFGSNGRSSSGLSRYQGLEGFGNSDFDFETSSQSSHDAYHQAASGGGGGSINGGTGKARGYTGPHLLGGEEFGVGGDASSANSAYIPNTYGGYHGAADYQHQPPPQQQQGPQGHAAHHPQQQHQLQQHAPGGYGGPGGYGPGQGQQGQGPHGHGQQRGMVRSNSRPLMLNNQGQPIQQQQQHHHHQQPKFQHKRYDPSQQFNNKK